MLKKLLLFVLPFLAVPVNASVVRVSSDTSGWQLLVDSVPYGPIHGIAYGTDKIGQDPNAGTYQDWMVMDENANGLIDGPYESFIDRNHNNTKDASEPRIGDFQLMKQMGVNTIRIYHHPSADPLMTACYPPATNPGGDLIWNHALNTTLLRDLYNTYGIRVAMGDEIGSYTTSSCANYAAGTDYTDPVQIASMTYSVTRMVADSKDEPWLLMYVLGNENNYSFTHTNASTNPTAYYQFVSSMTNLIHSLDPYHPVALANGETQFLAQISTHVPTLDIFGANVYRAEGTYQGFGTFWTDVSSVWNKPVMITEYGSTLPLFVGGVQDEGTQSAILLNYACDIQRHSYGHTAPKNAIGGFDYQWLDSWWQNSNPTALYTGTPNNETTGLNAQGSITNSPFQRWPKAAYYMYQSLWAGQCIQCL